MERLAEGMARAWFSMRHARRFKSIGATAYIAEPFRADGPESISLGAESFVQRGAWLYCVGVDGIPARLSIGAGCVFGYNNHITAVRSIQIDDHVLTANNVYISDVVHGYRDPDTPIMHPPVEVRRPVRIGRGSWLGENVCIIGASVGRNSVIGANAVVTSDIGDRCVAVGIPARVIRHFDDTTGTWVPGDRQA